MVHTIHRLTEFLRYQQRAQTKYYIHSPFVYQFYLNVLEGEASPETKNIKELRQKLLQTYDKILIDDMGAAPGQKEKTVSQLAAKASIPDKYGLVLYHLARYFRTQVVVELGTCLGIGTAYMASALPEATVTTIEGSKSLSDLAQKNFNGLGVTNIRQLAGNFDQKLPELLTSIPGFDLVFIDGNHRYEPTMRYFNQLMAKAHDRSILVFDDIYWSPEMTQAWHEIEKDPRINLTIDIYRFGIAFVYGDKLAKEGFTLRY